MAVFVVRATAAPIHLNSAPAGMFGYSPKRPRVFKCRNCDWTMEVNRDVPATMLVPYVRDARMQHFCGWVRDYNHHDELMIRVGKAVEKADLEIHSGTP